MTPSLPDIDPEKITTLEEARDAMHLLMNSFEQLTQLFLQAEDKIARLEDEVRHLKGQPKKPQFTRKKEYTIESVRKLLKEKGVWEKTSKKDIPIDEEREIISVVECVCGSQEFTVLRTKRKVVQGLVFRRHTVQYSGRDRECVECGRVYRVSLPKETFSLELQTAVSFLKFFCRMSEPLMYRFFKGFGVRISTGEINAILLQNGRTLTQAYAHLKTQGFKKSIYLGSDATGAKRREKNTGQVRNQYVQVVSNKWLSVYGITRHYTAESVRRFLGTYGREKPYVSDDGSQNGERLKVKVKQLCLVHEIRHYKKLFSFFTPYKELRQQILSQWQQLYHLSKHYAEAPPKQREKQKKEILNLFAKITNQITRNLTLNHQLRLTRKKQERLFTFLKHPELPIHNNQCEQDLREFVIQRRISHETKSLKGDRSIAKHLTVIQTAQKQHLNIFETLHGLLTHQLSPAILTANIT